MRFVVTLCNTKGGARLAGFAPERGFEPLPACEAEAFQGATGATGCERFGGSYVVALQGHPAALAVFDASFEYPRRVTLAYAQDVHGLLVHESHLLVVSTGSDTVLRYDSELAFVDRVGAGESALIDREHVNDLCLADGRVVGAKFGPRRSSGLRNGAVYDLATGEVLFDGFNEPHSVVWAEHRLHVLDSATGTLFRLEPGLGPQRLVSIIGYARGLYVHADWLLVGRSTHRQIGRNSHFQHASRLAATEAGAHELDDPGIFALNRRDDSWRFFSCAAIGPEIYGIFRVDGP